MDAPTAEQVRARTPRMDWGSVGFPVPPENQEDLLGEEVLDAVEYVQNTTGQTLVAMPAALVRTALRAIIMRTQQQVFQSEQDAVESASDELTANFSAGNYSEARRGFAEHKTQNEALMVNSWPELNRLLWQLMTAEMRAYWMGLLSGEGTPWSGVTEVDWDHTCDHGGWPELGDPYKTGPWPWGF